MLNWIWLGLILVSVLYAAFTGRMAEVNREIVDSAIDAIELVVRLTGPMVLFLGLMSVAREGGLLLLVARWIAPLMRRLFPDVPADHPAMGAMVMNIASNALGLGNAATPFGLKAMTELRTLNPRPGIATDSMVLFLAINTSSVTLLPSGTIAVRGAAGSENAAAIFPTTLLATLASTLMAVGACFLLRRLGGLRFDRRPEPPAEEAATGDPDLEEVAASTGPESLPPLASRRVRGVLALFWIAFGVALALHAGRLTAEAGTFEAFQEITTHWLLAALAAFLLWFGVRRRVRVYEAAVAGGKEGLEVALRIAPYLVAILVMVGMLRASGALGAFIGLLEPLTSAVGVPGEALPMALLRPLSGSGAYGVMTEILETHGPDSFVGLLASTLQGSTETTFYVLALYLGAARVRDGRHSLPSCLLGDLAGFVAAVAACHWFFA